MKAGKRPYAREPGLHLVVAFVEGAFSIVRAAPVRDARRFRLQEPRLVEENVRLFPSAASETTLAVLDEKGRVLDSFGWPTRSQAFFDRDLPGVRGGLSGSPGDARLTHRILSVPLRPEAAFLLFYVSELPASGERRISWRALGLYYLTPEPIAPPTLPIPFPKPIEALPLPPFPSRKRFRHKRRRPKLTRASIAARSSYVFQGGYVVDYFTAVDNGPSGSRFNIVLLGDGFLFEETPLFVTRATHLAHGLLQVEPFATLAHLINVHVVVTASWESGVDNCPALGTYKNTYYNVEGDFRQDGYAGYFGTHTPLKVWGAADLVVPMEDVDVMVMLVNVDFRGGSAPPDGKIAFVAHWDTDEDDVNIAAHECAHVLNRTAEEYIGCNPHDPMVVYPNQATDVQVASLAVPWIGLAQAGETSTLGQFVVVHRRGDAFALNGEQPLMKPAALKKLGLFWGCQDVDPPVLSGPCSHNYYQRPEGARFFRPMAKCKMRRRGYPFCRVCSTLIANSILSAT